MIKKIMPTAIFLISLSSVAFPIDMKTLEKAVSASFIAVPEAYTYYEESGALFFVQKKKYRYDIIYNNGTLFQLVTYSSTQDEHPLAEDPRPPVREGDCSNFCMKELMYFADIFCPEACLQKNSEEIVKIDGKHYLILSLSYWYRGQDGSIWPMCGELFIDQNLGIPRFFKVEQREFPSDLYSVKIEVDFDGCSPEDCRITELRRWETGQYGIFRYRYDSIRTFEY